MAIDRMSPDFEKPFRKALGHAIRGEIADMAGVLLDLDDKHAAFCLAMCSNVTGFVAIDVSQRQWPNETDIRDIAGAATRWPEGDTFDLREEDSYAYVKRVALGFEPLHEVFPDPETSGTLPFVITGRLLVSFHPADVKWWDYLSRIEDVVEATAQADLDLLPGLMLRSRRLGSPRVFGEIRRG
jgi:hypothetical protein